MSNDNTPGAALAKLLEQEIRKMNGEDLDTTSAKKEFNSAQSTWAKNITKDGTARITIGEKEFAGGEEI
jgi:hypothetical protein